MDNSIGTFFTVDNVDNLKVQESRIKSGFFGYWDLKYDIGT